MALLPTEQLLHFIWQYQKIASTEPTLTNGKTVRLIKPGSLNTNAGPDFFNAHISIDSITWIGNIEVHVKASDWLKHEHTNKHYQEVILHVVWEHDTDLTRPNGEKIPCLELKNIVNNSILDHYQTLLNSKSKIACEQTFPQVNSFQKHLMLDKLAIARLERKAKGFLKLLEYYHTDWEQACYHWLLKYMGFKVNAQPMEQLAQQLPYKVVKRISGQEGVIALLLGQAGFTNIANTQAYALSITKEYNYLAQKHQLKSPLPHYLWKYSRLRPANFPELRLATLGQLLFRHKDLFSQILNTENILDLKKIFKVEPHTYWSENYRLDRESAGQKHTFGEASLNLLLINVVAPYIAAYGIYKQDYTYLEKAQNLTEQLKSEPNSIVSMWKNLGLEIRNASDSQAAIEWFTNYCEKKRCLECQVAYSILH
jgi:hypothetical protein